MFLSSILIKSELLILSFHLLFHTLVLFHRILKLKCYDLKISKEYFSFCTLFRSLIK